MIKSILLGTVAVGMTVFATGAMAQATSTPLMNNGVQGANEAFILQGGSGYGGSGYGGNYANIDQGGSNSKIGKLNYNVDLSASALDAGTKDNDTAYANTVLQVGSSNQMTLTQNGSNNEVLSRPNNLFTVGAPSSFDRSVTGGSFQSGRSNAVTSTQNGANGQVQFQQIGNNNGATISVYSGAQNTYAGVFQNGGSNNAAINQYDGSNNAYAAVIQNGSSNYGQINQQNTTNYAGILQVNDGNNAVISQYASNVGGLVYQNGYSNSAELVQARSLANAAATQYGTNNYARINQR